MDDNTETQPNSPLTKQRKLQGIQNRDNSLDPDGDTEQVACGTLRDARHTIGWSRSYKRKRSVANTLHDQAEAKSPVIKRAEKILSNLADSFPSFLKTLVRSNCKFGYWMHLPMPFCKSHMPKRDATFTLENEKEEVFKAHYIAERTALSGGWKAFAAAHELDEGDVLVFHLVEPSKFKIYIVKATHSDSEDRGSGFNQFDSDFAEEDTKLRKSAKNWEIVPVATSQENSEKDSMMLLDTGYGHVADQSDALQVKRSSGPIIDFDVKSIDDFTILVNGVNIDPELSDDDRTKYYELCRSQKSFLHNLLLNSINHKLATEIIAQTVSIAESIKASNFLSSQDDYAIWDKTLTGFELLGMNVGFLRARLNRLMSLASESEEAKVLQRCRKLELEKAHAEEEMRNLELKISELKKSVERLDVKMENLQAKAERHELMFQEEANAPW